MIYEALNQYAPQQNSPLPSRRMDNIYPEFELLGVGKGLVNAVQRAITSKLAAKVGTKLYSEATFKAFERQLAKDGMKSILKTQSRIQKNLAEHIQKLAEIKKMGGYSSSVEREIRTFQSQLDVIKDLLK